MKNSELLNHLGAIELVKDLKLSGKISLILAKNKKKIVDSYETIEKLRITMCEKYADKDENGVVKKDESGKTFIFAKESEEQLNKEYTEVLEQDSKIELEVFSEGLIEQYKDITPMQVEALLLFTINI